ncbi:hypothetical protein HBI06_249740 [Parastagonospora nodorum]|nr:hypothetical protein HBI06_249740 [Parastagonospora nodorum]KAH4223072.1 hypothetical protein HBI05_250180 [Parastagonospora nodorum]
MCSRQRLAEELVTVESITAKDSNYVNTFSLDFTFLFAITILIRLLIARGNNILLLIAFIISYRLFADKLVYALNRVTVVLIIILFISITKICNPLLKKNVAKSRILLACADRRIRQCYLTICAILKHYNFNIYVSLATDTLYLLLKGLTSIEQKAIIQQLIAIISLLFILKAPFALHFIRAVYNLHVLTYIIQDIRIYRALDSIYTRANSEAYYITIPYLTKLPLSEIAINIAISNFIYAAAQSSSKRHNDSKHCNKKLYLILIIIDYTCYDKDRKHIAYIKNAASKRWILQAFKFYNLSTIICLVHLVLRDLLNSITRTTMSYYVNNYIN